MRWYISYPILAAGLAFGFDTLFPGSPDFSSTKAQAQRSTEPEAARNVVLASELDASRIPAFSPGVQFAAVEQQQAASGSVLDYLAQTLMPRASAPATPVPEALAPITVGAWTVTRVALPPKPVPAVRPDRASRLALARDIQRELQRVGCYLGEIDGVWGGGSKRAILTFMDRVNATLPTREPDVIMLTLLRTQTDAVCGTTCPRGQSLTANGRCMPSTLMAQAEKAGEPPPNSRETSWETVVAEAAPGRRPEPYGRMSIGGPNPDDVAQLSTGWPRATERPRAADPALPRTAALGNPATSDEVTLPVDGDVPQSAASSFDTDVAPAPPTAKRTKSGSRSKGSARAYRTSSSRHVQRLFTHPLGSM